MSTAGNHASLSRTYRTTWFIDFSTLGKVVRMYTFRDSAVILSALWLSIVTTWTRASRGVHIFGNGLVQLSTKAKCTMTSRHTGLPEPAESVSPANLLPGLPWMCSLLSCGVPDRKSFGKPLRHSCGNRGSTAMLAGERNIQAWCLDWNPPKKATGILPTPYRLERRHPRCSHWKSCPRNKPLPRIPAW